MTESFKQPEVQPSQTPNHPLDNTSDSFDHNINQTSGDHTEIESQEDQSDLSNAQVSVSPSSEVEEDWSEKTESTPETSATSTEGLADQAQEQASTSELEQVISILQQDVASWKGQLDQQIQQTESFKGQYMRLAADFENFRRRTAKEKEELEYQIKKNTVTELLGAIDSFERARSQIKPGTDGEMTIHKSYQGVYKQLVDGLKKLGVSAMRPEGEQFDPNYHEAVFREQTNDHPEGTVLEQLVRGYFLNDKVLRHAMVKVAAPKEDEVIEEITQAVTQTEEISSNA